MKKKARDIDVTVAGITGRVSFDGDRPLYAIPAARPGEDPRLVELAMKTALDAALRAARATKRKRDSDLAAKASATKRTKASADHWTNEWFALAHARQPRYGKDRLAQLARSLAAKEDDEAVKAKTPDKRIPAKKRDQITVERARQFLERKRNASP